MCLSFEEKIRANKVAEELDNIGEKLMELCKSQQGKIITTLDQELDKLWEQHTILMKELKAFVDKC